MFDVERIDPAQDGAVREKHTCRECKRSIVHELRDAQGRPLPDNALMKRFTAYRAQASGVHGRCPTCTKIRRDERYPLHDKV